MLGNPLTIKIATREEKIHNIANITINGTLMKI